MSFNHSHMKENYSPVIYTSTKAGDFVSAALQIFSLKLIKEHMTFDLYDLDGRHTN